MLAYLAARASAIAAEPGGGHALLAALSREGWYVCERAAFGGGILIIAEHPRFGRVTKSGESAAVIAPDVLEAALALTGGGPLQ